jgi:hypothetical protein
VCSTAKHNCQIIRVLTAVLYLKTSINAAAQGLVFSIVHPAHLPAEFEENLVLHVQVVRLAIDTLVIRDLKTPSCVLVDSIF